MAKIKHHALSMSRWNALAVCPHFTPNPKPSEEAAEGALAHEEVVRVYEASANEEEAQAKDFELKYPQAQWCASRWHYLKAYQDMPGGYTVRCAVETKLEIHDTHPILDGIYGFADFVRIIRKKEDNSLVSITIADFKTFSDGKRVYDEQLAGYAVAVASTLPDATDETAVMLYTMHGAVKFETVSHTTVGECRRLALEIIAKYLGRDQFPQVANKMCKYCKNCPCKGAVAQLAAVVPAFAAMDISPKAMNTAPESVPIMLSAIDDAQRILETAKENAREVIRKHGVRNTGRDGLNVWMLGNQDCAYAIKEQAGRKVIAPEIDNSRIIAILGQDEFITAAKISVKDLANAYARIKTAVSGKKVAIKEAETMLIENGLIARGKPFEKLERVN